MPHAIANARYNHSLRVRPQRLALLVACACYALLAAGHARAQVTPAATPTPSTSATATATAITQPITLVNPLDGLLNPLTTAPAPEYTTSFAEVECPFVVPWNQEMICGELEVPENRANADSERISLFITILKSLGRPELDPILVLPDGPGAEGTSQRQLFYSAISAPFRSNRDIILFDPRCAGYSTPSLNCPEVDDAAPDSLALLEAYHACYTRLLDAGRDLSAYTSSAQVADITDLAQTLGIGTLNIYATGYGTRVAALLADRHPNLVRSMVLDGVLPVSANALLEQPLNLYAAIQRVAQDCTATPACNAAYPALEARLLEVIDRFNATPAPMGYGSGGDILALLVAQMAQGGSVIPAIVTALFDEDFATACAVLPPTRGCGAPGGAAVSVTSERAAPQTSAWRNHLPNADDPVGESVETISWLMRTLGYKTPSELFSFLDTQSVDAVTQLLAEAPLPTTDRVSEGLAATLLCAEDAPFFTRADLQRVAARIPGQFGTLPVAHAASVNAICTFWQMPPLPLSEKLLQPILAPVLLVNGTHDVQTPPTWARRAASAMEQGRVQLFPGAGHALLAGGDTCLPAMMQLFYANPAAREQAACADALTLDFLLPSDEPLP